MMTVPKFSSCVDCATPIIGERLRCPACHDRHAVNLLSGDEDVTLPRRRSAKSPSVREELVAWLGIPRILVIVAVLLVVAGRKCL